MLDVVERVGVFGGYLGDLCFTPKTLKAVRLVQAGQLGRVTWAVARDASRPAQRVVSGTRSTRSVGEVGRECRLRVAVLLSPQFKQHHGVGPREYRQQA